MTLLATLLASCLCYREEREAVRVAEDGTLLSTREWRDLGSEATEEARVRDDLDGLLEILGSKQTESDTKKECPSARIVERKAWVEDGALHGRMTVAAPLECGEALDTVHRDEGGGYRQTVRFEPARTNGRVTPVGDGHFLVTWPRGTREMIVWSPREAEGSCRSLARRFLERRTCTSLP